ncbi:MAG: iron-containing alcohol dehydrogenase [Clostridioides sp.]|nr:iron-containing alcohol dehydrogenase [Clostridioides sp.]
MNYYMPTKIIQDKDCVVKNSSEIKSFGELCLIITGHNSSKRNGSLDDVKIALDQENIEYFIFDEVEENPSKETVQKIVSLYKSKNIDFLIGVGGGSAIDTAKAVSLLLKNVNTVVSDIFVDGNLDYLPLLAIPTTAGTGSETTPYSIITDKDMKTKRGIATKVFPVLAFLDAKYLLDTPINITINTAIDTLAHLVEGYLSTNSNALSIIFAEYGLHLFSEYKSNLINGNFPYEIREKLILASTIAGILISQSGTSLPHGMSYPLTYFHNVPHGKGCGILLAGYLNLYEKSSKSKVDTVISALGFDSISEFKVFIDALYPDKVALSKVEVSDYSANMFNNKEKLKNHPLEVTLEDIEDIYKSL